MSPLSSHFVCRTISFCYGLTLCNLFNFFLIILIKYPPLYIQGKSFPFCTPSSLFLALHYITGKYWFVNRVVFCFSGHVDQHVSRHCWCHQVWLYVYVSSSSWENTNPDTPQIPHTLQWKIKYTNFRCSEELMLVKLMKTCSCCNQEIFKNKLLNK